MLTKADDYPVHQTPDPAAVSGTDRNFYDRYFFNGINPDGTEFFALAFGIYPNVNIADAHFAVLRDGVQYNLHASRVLHMERMDLRVGPISIEVIEPLQRLRLRIEGEGILAELNFTGRAFPVQEPRFTHLIGRRAVIDYTRLTQNGRWTGWMEVDGDRRVLSTSATGTRDRSWGIRPIGGPEAQPAALLPVYWLRSTLNFANFSCFFHADADAQGRPLQSHAVFCEDRAEPDSMLHCEAPRMEVTWRAGERHAARATLHASFAGRAITIDIVPQCRFQMRGIGYAGSSWPHGADKGELAVAREDFRPDQADPTASENRHIQAPSRVMLQQDGRAPHYGIGVLEQCVELLP